MESLNLYKNLSFKENILLEDFLVYREIYKNAEERKIKLENEEIVELKSIILNYYYDFSNTISIAETVDFISKNYLDDNITMQELKDADKHTMQDALENNNINLVLNRNTQFIKESKVNFVNENYCIEDLENDRIYAYDISRDFYADCLLVKKIEDKIISSFAWKDEDNKLRVSEVNDETEIDYDIVNFNDFKNDNMNYFYNKILICRKKDKEDKLDELNIDYNNFISDMKINQIDKYDIRDLIKNNDRVGEENAR